MGRPRPEMGCSATKKNNHNNVDWVFYAYPYFRTSELWLESEKEIMYHVIKDLSQWHILILNNICRVWENTQAEGLFDIYQMDRRIVEKTELVESCVGVCFSTSFNHKHFNKYITRYVRYNSIMKPSHNYKICELKIIFYIWRGRMAVYSVIHSTNGEVSL